MFHELFFFVIGFYWIGFCCYMAQYSDLFFFTVAKIRFVSKLCLFLNYPVQVSFQWCSDWYVHRYPYGYVYVRLSMSTAVCACVCASTVCLCGART